MPTVSTHVLDVASGRAAPGVAVALISASDGSVLATAVTDADGRIADGLGGVVSPGRWRLSFDLGAYYAAQQIAGVLSTLEVTLFLDEERHFHVPVLATPNSATTYLGT
jgi:5-hydroxyisourate hydrolase